VKGARPAGCSIEGHISRVLVGLFIAKDQERRQERLGTMGKAKTSRKGKKAWRKNIDSGEHDALVEKTAKEARIGGPLDQLPDDSLFFVDKEKGG
jgi:hypothetical protein